MFPDNTTQDSYPFYSDSAKNVGIGSYALVNRVSLFKDGSPRILITASGPADSPGIEFTEGESTNVSLEWGASMIYNGYDSR